MKILIIGGGNMGSAIAKGIKESKPFEKLHLAICEKNKEREKNLKDISDELIFDLDIVDLHNFDILLIAVKPQDFIKTAKKLKNINDKHLFISIAAGIDIKTIRENCFAKKIIRVMPNTPALIGEAMSGWIANKEVNEKDKEVVRKILQSLGEEVELHEEDQIDAITAISGSGPAYYFYILDSMMRAAIKLNLPKNEIEKIVFQTCIGSVKLAMQSDDDVKTLEEKVTSKGGTTEAALTVYKNRELDSLLKEACEAAYKKAKDLRRQ